MNGNQKMSMCRNGFIAALILLAVSFTTSLVHADEPSPLSDVQYRECKEWHQSAGFSSLEKLPWVRVATGYSYASGGKKHNTYLLGYLSDVSMKEDAAHFEITTLDRAKQHFQATDPDTEESEQVGYTELDFDVWVKAYLAKEQNEKIDNPDRLTGGGPFSETPSSTALTTLHLAMECDRWGLTTEARKLMARLPQLLANETEETVNLSLPQRLEREYGHLLMWGAVIACDDPKNDRAKLRDGFLVVTIRAPNSRHAGQAKRMADLLGKMIQEDAQHAAERARVPFKKLSPEDQIKDLIFRLRDQDGTQMSQPGSCSIFGYSDKQDSAADKIVEIGFDAIPQLIDSLVDDSLTYSVGYHRNFYFSHRVLTVGDAAEQIIEEITGTPLPTPPNIRVFGRDPVQDQNLQLKNAQQVAARAWWQDFKTKGERAYLIEAVSQGGHTGSSLAPRLAERYPDDALKACKSGLAKSQEAWDYRNYVSAIAYSELPGSETIVRAVIAENRYPDATMTAITWLCEKAPDEAITLAVKFLKQDGSWKNKDDFGDLFADDLIGFLVDEGDASGLRAVISEYGRTTLDQRVDVAMELYGAELGELAEANAQELLVSLLEDPRRRTGMSGSVGDLTFSDPRVCDMAAATLSKNWPTLYKFNFNGTAKERDRECIANANIWRKLHGQSLLQSEEREVKKMSGEEFDALLKKAGDITNADNLNKFVSTLEEQGVPALPHLMKFTEAADAPAKERLVKVAQNLANRVERIVILPKDAHYEPVTKWVKQAEGRPLDGESVVKLLSSFFLKADQNGEPYRGIKFEALRHDDMSGIDITIRLVKRERPKDKLDQWNGSENVTAGDNQTHWAGYGGGLSKDDPKESEELRQGVDKALAFPPGTPCEIRWELIGWWHDD